MDYRLFHVINHFAGTSAWLDSVMVLVAVYSPVVFVGTVVWLWVRSLHSARGARDRMAVGRALAAAAVALGLGQVTSRAFPRPRPFQAHAVHLLIARSPDPSFPSDHALASFAIAAAISSTHPETSAGLFILAALLSLARVYVGTHYPLDVIAGAFLGGLAGCLIHRADAWIRPAVSLGARCTDACIDWLTSTWQHH